MLVCKMHGWQGSKKFLLHKVPILHSCTIFCTVTRLGYLLSHCQVVSMHFALMHGGQLPWPRLLHSKFCGHSNTIDPIFPFFLPTHSKFGQGMSTPIHTSHIPLVPTALRILHVVPSGQSKFMPWMVKISKLLSEHSAQSHGSVLFGSILSALPFEASTTKTTP